MSKVLDGLFAEKGRNELLVGLSTYPYTCLKRVLLQSSDPVCEDSMLIDREVERTIAKEDMGEFRFIPFILDTYNRGSLW